MTDKSSWISIHDKAAEKGLLRKQFLVVCVPRQRLSDPSVDDLIYVTQAVSLVSSSDVISVARNSTLYEESGTYWPGLVSVQSGLTGLSHEQYMNAHRFWLERAVAVWVIRGPGNAWLRSRECLEEAQFAVANNRLLFLPEINDE